MVWEGKDEVKVDIPYLMTDEDYGVDLTVVVPCYNEFKRFPENFEITYKVNFSLSKLHNSTCKNCPKENI